MANRYWNKQNVSNAWNATAPTNWGSASNTADNASVPGSGDDVFFDGVGGGAADSLISTSFTINSLDCTGYANTLSQDDLRTLTISGSGVVFKLSSGMTFSRLGTTTQLFTGTSGTTLITTAGKSLGNVNFNGVGGTWQLQDSLSIGGVGLTLTNGTFDANNQNITAPLFTSSNSNTRTLLMGTGTWTLTAGGGTTIWDASTSTSLTLIPSTSTIKLTGTSGAHTFAGGGLTYNNLWFSQGANASSITVSGSNTFNDFKDDGTAAHSILFTAGTTQTVSTFTVSGTVGKLITINSTTTATHTLSAPLGKISCDYLNIQHSVATGGARWYAGANSIDNQLVVTAGSGWIFSAAPTVISPFPSYFH